MGLVCPAVDSRVVGYRRCYELRFEGIIVVRGG